MNYLSSLPSELLRTITAYLDNSASRIFSLTCSTLRPYGCEIFFDRIVIPTPIADADDIPKYVEHSTSVMLPNSLTTEENNYIFAGGDDRKYTDHFLLSLLTKAPKLQELHIQHPITAVLFRMILKRIRSDISVLDVSGNAFYPLRHELNLIAKSSKTKNLLSLTFSPKESVKSAAFLTNDEEKNMAAIIHRSFGSLTAIDLGFAQPTSGVYLQRILPQIHGLVTLDLGGYPQSFTTVVATLLNNNPNVHSLSAMNLDLSQELDHSPLALAFITFPGQLNHLEITIRGSVPLWLLNLPCLDRLNSLFIQFSDPTVSIDTKVIQWISRLRWLRRLSLSETKIDINVEFGALMSSVCSLSMCNAFISLAALSTLLISAQALRSLKFHDLFLQGDTIDKGNEDIVSGLLDTEDLTVLRSMLASSLTSASISDARCWLWCKTNNILKEGKQLNDSLRQKWADVRCQPTPSSTIITHEHAEYDSESNNVDSDYSIENEEPVLAINGKSLPSRMPASAGWYSSLKYDTDDEPEEIETEHGSLSKSTLSFFEPSSNSDDVLDTLPSIYLDSSGAWSPRSSSNSSSDKTLSPLHYHADDSTENRPASKDLGSMNLSLAVATKGKGKMTQSTFAKLHTRRAKSNKAREEQRVRRKKRLRKDNWIIGEKRD